MRANKASLVPLDSQDRRDLRVHPRSDPLVPLEVQVQLVSPDHLDRKVSVDLLVELVLKVAMGLLALLEAPVLQGLLVILDLQGSRELLVRQDRVVQPDR